MNRDDFPNAAGKHLSDAEMLLSANRYDGSAYLAGYVVECAMKTLIQVESGRVIRTHSFETLTNTILFSCALAGARTSKYITTKIREIPQAPIAHWKETMRYHAPHMTQNDTTAWVNDAKQIYTDSIAHMILDGVI